MSIMHMMNELVAIVPMVDVDDYLSGGGVPEGGRPVLRVINVITAWLILIAGAVGIVYTIIKFISYMRDNARVSDIMRPLVATLVVLSIGVILQIASGVFSGILRAA